MRNIILSMLMIFSISAFAQTPYYTRQYNDNKLEKTAARWFDKGEWRNGYTKANPNWCVNKTEFYEQYQSNPEAWKAAFKWLNDNDLQNIAKGKYYIDLSDGTKMTVSIEDTQNDSLQKRKTESHLKVCDFMTVVKGTEGFRRLDHVTSRQSTDYKPDVIRYDYDAKRAQEIICPEGEFLIFFPSDWHIAKVLTPEKDQSFRVIVIKVPYKE